MTRLRQSVEQAVHLCDATTVAYWLQRFLHARGGDRINRLVPEPPGGGDVERERILQQWYLDRLLEISPASVWVPEWVVRRADIHETQGELSDAIAVLSQAINRHPNGEELLKKRARLYEKTLQWKLATEDRRAAAQADPMDHQGRYWVGTMLLYNDDVEVYRQLCHEMLERWGESDDPRIQERTAKLCLMLPVDGDDFERACSMIDAAYDAVATDWFRNHDVLVKALADCRRNRYDEAIKNVTEANAAFDERGRNMPIFSALGDLIAAMAWHKKGDPQLARRKYADALDRIDYVYELYIETGGLVPHDWMMAEIVRREAETLLGVSAETLDLPLPDTQDWKVVLSDDFDRDEVGDAWTVKNGQWALEDGALRGTVENQGASTMPSAGIRALDVKMPEYLEVEYDTWWPEGAISEVKLSDLDTRRDYIAGLCGSPHPILVGRGETGTGAQMLSSIAGRSGAGRWIAKDPEFELKPGQRYHIRLLRQPNRLTLFVDGKEIFSELVPTIDARTLRFYGSGPESAILYFDNLVVRAPEGEKPQ